MSADEKIFVFVRPAKELSENFVISVGDMFELL